MVRALRTWLLEMNSILGPEFLWCVEDDFLTQVVIEPTREIFPPDLLLAISERLLGVVMTRSCLGHGNPEMIAFTLW